MRIKVDKIVIDKSWMGYSVQAIKTVDGQVEQVGNKAILPSEFDAKMYALLNYQLPAGDPNESI